MLLGHPNERLLFCSSPVPGSEDEYEVPPGSAQDSSADHSAPRSPLPPEPEHVGPASESGGSAESISVEAHARGSMDGEQGGRSVCVPSVRFVCRQTGSFAVRPVRVPSFRFECHQSGLCAAMPVCVPVRPVRVPSFRFECHQSGLCAAMPVCVPVSPVCVSSGTLY